jgi:cyclopropane-fatty-acyl-phospholipid synthase
MEFTTGLAEQGWLPDAAIRWGIRQRLRAAIVEGQEKLRSGQEAAFRASLRAAPIAINTAEANEQHYELPPEFFEAVLGARRKYSCCLYARGDEALEQAEEAMLRLTCERAGIENGMRVLDLGCGWGAFSLWVAEHYPECRVTAVSNASNQRRFIERQAAARGLTNIEVVTRDINAFRPDCLYDRIVSVEMFEHVRNHRELLRRISRWLKDDGRLFVHIFCNERHAYPYETEGDANWMGRYFFTGGIMPSFDLLTSYDDDLRIEQSWRVNGRHYARTCNQWLERMDANRDVVMPIMQATYGDDAQVWYQRWRMFFIACAELFDYDGGREWFVAHYVFEPVAVEKQHANELAELSINA